MAHAPQYGYSDSEVNHLQKMQLRMNQIAGIRTCRTCGRPLCAQDGRSGECAICQQPHVYRGERQ